tara:strand:+ start:1386 stop:1685 length:300 start_codon:yes stop_codon:yes gene_type:complete
MTKAVLINEELGNVKQIEIDIDPRKNEIFKILSGRATFIGQWPDIDVVLVKCVEAAKLNENVLPPPFQDEEVYGKIILIRMDENSEPRDFTLKEFQSLE